jgi:P27 family predicted phage terminase small subunit
LTGAEGRRINKREPKIEAAPATFDTPPEELNGDEGARAEWARVVPVLRAAGMLSVCERSVLILYCTTWAQWLTAQADVRTRGMVYARMGGGAPVVNPYWKIAAALYPQLQRLLVELGLTPSARSRLIAADVPIVETPASKWQGAI